MVVHEGSRNPHTSVMKNTTENQTQTLNTKTTHKRLNAKNHILIKPHGKQLTRECRDPQWRQQCPKRREGELERLLNKGGLFFWFCIMGLLSSTGVLCFDSFVVSG